MHSPEQSPLSARQAEIAALVTRGKSTREIADALNLSPRTVETHVVAIFNKLGVRSRVELTAALLEPTAPLRALDAIPNNLPRKLTSFIGRQTEIAEISALIKLEKLVSLVGSPGVGKTSVSLEVAVALLSRFNDGVWLIELAQLAEGRDIPAAVALALGLTLAADSDPLTSLAKQLGTRRALLIFDNCEHLVNPAARAIASILRDCRNVKVLISSRQPLRVAGEVTYRIPTLSVPTQTRATVPRAADILDYEATRLFVERAFAVDNRFALGDDNAPAIAEICRRLDGIPLAIELAAARIAMLSPQQLRDQLDERFRILTGGSRGVVARHQTLRALIDWSFDLLDVQERTLFRRLGIFARGFTLAAAVAVCDEDQSERNVGVVLQSLVDKSLAVLEPFSEEPRYRLLESTRLYALEKLALAGEQRSTASRQLHYLRDHFTALRAQAERAGPRSGINRAFATELENIRGALDGARGTTDIVVAADLLANIRDSWRFLELRHEGMTRIQQTLSLLPDSESRSSALLLGSLSRLLYENGRSVDAFDAAARGLAHARASRHDPTLALTLCYHAHAAIADRKLDVAEASLAEAEAFAGSSVALDLRLLRERAAIHYMRGDFDSAVRSGELLFERCRSLGDVDGTCDAALLLARYEFARGETQRATDIARENLVACRVDADWLLPHTLLILATCLADAGDLCGATAVADEALGLWADVEPSDADTGVGILVRAFVFALSANLARAAILEGYAAAVILRHGSASDAYEPKVHARLVAILRDGLEPNEIERLTAEGAALSPQEAIALALSGNA